MLATPRNPAPAWTPGMSRTVARPIVLTPVSAARHTTRLAARLARPCAWCGITGHNHGTRYTAMRGHHPHEPSGWKPLRGVEALDATA